jgi:hypothetical protein
MCGDGAGGGGSRCVGIGARKTRTRGGSSCFVMMAVPPANPALDLHHDGIINIFDRLIVLQNTGDGCP